MKIRTAFLTTALVAGLAGAVSFARPVAAATTSPVVALSAGDEHTCALHADGMVQCWGSNTFGQLGNPDVETTAVPVPVALPADAHATAIATGAFHTCAVTQDHRVFCWGNNGFGQLGIGEMASQNTPALVTLAPTDAVASDVTAGGFTSCVLLSNGRAQCWGRNQYGEVGDGTVTLRSTPTPVVGIGDAVDIDAGTNHACVLRSVGRAQCWGRSLDGRTADSTFANVAQVSAGGAHTCLRTTVGALRCWGANTYGQLTPNNISGGVSDVATGGFHTCIASDGGVVVCWGEASFGQLGVSSIVSEGHRVEEVAAGLRHTCARLDDASVWCWGNSVAGQAGDHSLTIAAQPVIVIAGVPPAPVAPAPEPVIPEPVIPQPVTPEPAPETPALPEPDETTPAPVVAEPVVASPAPVEKQVAGAESGTVVENTPSVVPAPVAPTPVVPSIAKQGALDVRLGTQVGIVRLGRAAGVRLPGSLITSSMTRSRSVSAHPFTRLRVEVKVSHPRNCHNVLTSTLGAAVRPTRVGECRVSMRISRAGRADIVRSVIVRTVALAVPVINQERNTR